VLVVARGNAKSGTGYLRWSPTAQHISYVKYTYADFNARDVYRAKSDGSGATNLTKDLPYAAFSVAWR
jgi:hypothetical protein